MDLAGARRSSRAPTAASGGRSWSASRRAPCGWCSRGCARPPTSIRRRPVAGGAREVRAVRMDLSSRESIEECCAELGEELGRIDRARQQRRPDDRRPARGAGHRGGVRDVPGQPRRGRAPHAAACCRGCWSGARGSWSTTPRSAPTRISRRRAPTRRRRPAWSRSPNRCAASCAARGCARCTS